MVLICLVSPPILPHHPRTRKRLWKISTFPKPFVTLLQKGFSHREEAKSTKIFKKKFKKLKNLLRFLLFSSWALRFLCVLRASPALHQTQCGASVAVKGRFLQWTLLYSKYFQRWRSQRISARR
jgi:hypothetical protein